MNIGKILTRSVVIVGIAGCAIGSYTGLKNGTENAKNKAEILSSDIPMANKNDIFCRVTRGETTFKKANDSLKADKKIIDSLLNEPSMPKNLIDSMAVRVNKHQQNWRQACDSVKYLANAGFLKLKK